MPDLIRGSSPIRRSDCQRLKATALEPPVSKSAIYPEKLQVRYNPNR
jgi:hypothetical protein